MDSDTWTGTLKVKKEPVPVPIVCDKGIIVKVEGVPPEGLTVWLNPTGTPRLSPCERLVVIGEETVTPDKPTVSFHPLKPGDTICVRVTNKAGNVMFDGSDYRIPTTGCTEITSYGYLGKNFRSQMEAPARASPGELFTLLAHLHTAQPADITPDLLRWLPAPPAMKVEFFRINGEEDPLTNIWEEEERIGSDITGEEGSALLIHSEAEEGSYTYIARYAGVTTFAEPHSITIAAPAPLPPLPRCPIAASFILSSMPLPDLSPLRWFRDHMLPRPLTKVYYNTAPFIIETLTLSEHLRWIVRSATLFCSLLIRKGFEKFEKFHHTHTSIISTNRRVSR